MRRHQPLHRSEYQSVKQLRHQSTYQSPQVNTYSKHKRNNQSDYENPSKEITLHNKIKEHEQLKKTNSGNPMIELVQTLKDNVGVSSEDNK